MGTPPRRSKKSSAPPFGFDSSSNFVFFCDILVLLARLFTQDLKVAMLKRKLTTLTQTEALKEHEK